MWYTLKKNNKINKIKTKLIVTKNSIVVTKGWDMRKKEGEKKKRDEK